MQVIEILTSRRYERLLHRVYMSPVGRLLTALKGFSNPFWSIASKKFAQGAVGPVTAIQGPYLRTTSTFGTIEYPQLVGKNPITYIGLGW